MSKEKQYIIICESCENEQFEGSYRECETWLDDECLIKSGVDGEEIQVTCTNCSRNLS